jgi:hypothetical protein
MWREVLTFLLIYAVILGAHALHERIQRRRLHASKREAATLPARKGLRSLHRHALAIALTTATHPVTHAAVKEYVIHLVVYSGYVIH